MHHAGQFWSPYLGMGNKWINFIDRNGLFDSKFNAWRYNIFNGGGNITYQRVFEGEFMDPVSFGFSFEFALPKSIINEAGPLVYGVSFGLIADNKGISPYIVEKTLDLDANTNPAATFSLTMDGAIFFSEADVTLLKWTLITKPINRHTLK